MSAPGRYEAPVFRVVAAEGFGHESFGADASPHAERRSRDPVNQLGRALDQLCLSASDPYEIAAHLEALGYNTAPVAVKYGVADHFELARALFYRTPRRLGVTLPTGEVTRSYARQLIMVLTLLVTAGVGLFAQVSAWGPVLWLLVWSQLGGALLNRAKSELAAPQQAKILSLLLEFGVLGLGVTWLVTPFFLPTLTVSLLWLGVAGLLWAERLRAGYSLPSFTGALLLLVFWFDLPVAAALLAGCLGTLVALRPLVSGSSLASWRWAGTQARYLLPFLLYGLGQGALLLALLYGAGPEALPGVALFALVLLVSEPQLLRLRGRLNLYLWKGDSAEHYAHFARQAIARYTAAYLLPFVPALVLWAVPTLGGSVYLFHLWGFASLLLLLSLALVFLSLGDSLTPALIFVAGGGLVVVGVPFFGVAGVMALVLFGALLRRASSLGGYGVYLL